MEKYEIFAKYITLQFYLPASILILYLVLWKFK